MVLVDTSVIINYLKNVEDEYSNAFNLIIENNVPFGINNYIYQEILQGAKSEKEFNILKNFFDGVHFYKLKGQSSYEEAAKLNIRCRQNGVTIRSTIDLLIAQTAIENDVMLLANDSDYVNMKKVITELKLFEVY